MLIHEKVTNRNNATKITDYDVCGNDNCNACSQNELWDDIPFAMEAAATDSLFPESSNRTISHI